MSETRVAARYSQALFDLAEEKNAVNAVVGDANAFIKVVGENRGLELLLNSPIVHGYKKANVIGKIFNQEFNPLTTAFIGIVLRKHREMILTTIFEQFVEMYKEKEGILDATVYTAVPVSEQITNNIKGFLEKQTSAHVDLKVKVNEKLLGGFVLRYEDKLIDASVAAQLKALRNHFFNKN